MATKLDKDITRESSIKIDDREINITLTDKQEIKMKLKGMKSGELTISIEDLYNQLSGRDVAAVVEAEVKPKNNLMSIIRDDSSKDDDSPMINLNDLRSLNAISGFDIATLTKLDGLLAELIKNDKERKKALKESKTKKR